MFEMYVNLCGDHSLIINTRLLNVFDNVTACSHVRLQIEHAILKKKYYMVYEKAYERTGQRGSGCR